MFAERHISKATDLPPELRKQYNDILASALTKMPSSCRKQAIEALEPAWYRGDKSGVRFHPDIKTLNAECNKLTNRKDRNLIGCVIPAEWRETNGKDTFLQMHLDGGDGRGMQAIYLWLEKRN